MKQTASDCSAYCTRAFFALPGACGCIFVFRCPQLMFNISRAQISMYNLFDKMRFTILQKINTTQIIILQFFLFSTNQIKRWLLKSRIDQLNPRMASRTESTRTPGTYWWKASALTTRPTLLPYPPSLLYGQQMTPQSPFHFSMTGLIKRQLALFDNSLLGHLSSA